MHLQTRSSWSPSTPLGSPDLSGCKFISKLNQSRSPSASLVSLNLCLRVHVQTHSIMACMYFLKKPSQVYRDSRVTEIYRVMGSIYSADRRVHRHYLISITSFYTIIMYTLSFPNVSLTCSLPDFVDPGHCVDSQSQEVSYHLTPFLRSSNQHDSFL
jgi:hypothetical protein